MAKTYTVSSNSTYAPTQIGGHRVAYKIDAIPNPLNQQGLALNLNPAYFAQGTFVQGAGNDAGINFSNQQPAIYTRGLFQCFALCVAYNKVGQEFQNAYLAHISSPHGAFFNACLQNLPNPTNTELWAVVSIGPGTWGNVIAQKLVNFGIPADHIWIYVRQNQASGFGIDRFGNFGEVGG